MITPIGSVSCFDLNSRLGFMKGKHTPLDELLQREFEDGSKKIKWLSRNSAQWQESRSVKY